METQSDRLHPRSPICDAEKGPFRINRSSWDRQGWSSVAARVANIQLFDPASAALRIEAQRGFSQPLPEFFDCVHDGHAVCSTAFKTRAQIIVEDVAESPIFLGTPALEVVLDAGVRAVVSTPMVGSTGSILGILSTHRRRPWRPRHRELHLLNLLARNTGRLD
jgi:GAF domain